VSSVVQPHAQRRLSLGASLLPPCLHGVGARGGGGARRLQAPLHGVRAAGAESTRRVGASEETGVDSARGAALPLALLH